MCQMNDSTKEHFVQPPYLSYSRFGMGFLLQRPTKMNYLCIELNLSRTYMMIQLKISHGLTDLIVIDTF